MRKKFTIFVLVVILSLNFFAPSLNWQARAAQGSVDDAVENLALTTVESFVLEDDNRSNTVAVWQITNDSDVNVNIQDVRDLLDIALIEAGYDVTDRSKLDLIVSEQKLSMTGSVDESNLQEIGKVYGINAFIYGRISRVDSGPPMTITFFVKAIDVETGRFIFAKRVRGREVTEDQGVVVSSEKAESGLVKEDDTDLEARKSRYAQLRIDYSRIAGDEERENEAVNNILASTHASGQTRALARKYQDDQLWSQVWFNSSWIIIGLYWGAYFPFARFPESTTRVGIGVGISILGAGSMTLAGIFSPSFPPTLVQSYNNDVRQALNLAEADVL